MKKIHANLTHVSGDISMFERSGVASVVARLVRLFGVGAEVPMLEPSMAPVQLAANIEPQPMPYIVDQHAIFDVRPSLVRAFNALHTPIVIVGRRRVVLHANEEARLVFGEKITGRSFSLFLRDPKALDCIDNTADDGQAREIEISMEVPLKRRYKLNITRLPLVINEPMQMVLEFQEITLIHRSESMRSEFVANVSHELRSPLATLIGFIETLKEDGAAADTRERFLGIMDGEAQRMRRLIDDLLSLTNVELREHERPRARVDLAGVLQEVVNALFSRALAKDVSITLTLPQAMPAVMGDRDQLIQVFNNLITNAIKYGGDGKRVEVNADILENGLPEGGLSLEIRVRDYGQGIDAEHLPRLTERFYRVDKGRSRAVGGTGLGLAIVKHIVSRHRGRLFIDSERNKGSQFKVRLPAYPGDAHSIIATKS